MIKKGISFFKLEFFLALIIYCISILTGYRLIPQPFHATYTFYMLIISSGLSLILASECRLNSKAGKHLFIIGFVLISSIFILRKQTGIDDMAYQQIFNSANNISLWRYVIEGTVEKGYLILNYLIYYITNGNYDICQTLISGITFIFWGMAIWGRRKSLSITIATFILVTNYYFLIMSSALVRIFLATAIAFWSYKFIEEGKTKKYVVGIIFASLFHMSVLIMLILVLTKIGSGFFTRNWKLFIIVLIIAIPLILYLIVTYLVPIMGKRYSMYGMVNISFWRCIELIPILFYGVVFEKDLINDNKNQYITAMILIFMSLIFSVMGTLGRLVYYTNIGIIILLSSYKSIRFIGINRIKLFIPALITAYGFTYLFHTTFTNQTQMQYLFPYKSIFDFFNTV